MLDCSDDETASNFLEFWGLSMEKSQFSCLVSELGPEKMGSLIHSRELPGQQALSAAIKCEIVGPEMTKDKLPPVFTGKERLVEPSGPSTQIRPKKPDVSLIQAIDEENIDLVHMHIGFGTDPNENFVPDGFPFAGGSALHIAALKNNHVIVDVLHEMGDARIDIKARDAYQGTPLDWAAYWGLTEMVQHLIDMGADVNSKTILGTTPLDTANADNPFIPADDATEFEDNRERIKNILESAGGISGQ